jgi:eukaryotic-like serine/threonine-protein kinase
MNQPVPNRRVFKFGSFEADLDGGVLTKSGIRIKLQDQPFQILALLLERPGQVVTREEIRQKLWSENTFVEFDDGLNTAVRKLRAALGDSADNPRFLETVPRRGYRFVAPVIMPAESPGTVTEVRKEPILSDPARADSSPVAGPVESPLRGQHQIAWYAWRAAGVALFAVAAIAAYGYLRKPGFHVTARDTIVLADFENTTGEPVFDDALKQGLQVGLEQSPSLSILSERKTGMILRQMGRSPDERMTGRTAIEVCQRTGSKVAVQGSISSLGTTYLIGLGAIRCDNGEPITHQQVEAKRKEQVVVALGEATTRLRARLGESVPSLQKYNSPLEQATTPSLEALNAYGTALSTWDKKGDRASLPFLQRALDLDPNFAMAYGAMATIYHNLGEDELAQSTQPGRTN